MSSDFSDLLFEAEKLTNTIDGTDDLPKVDRSLRQVLEASNELYSRVAQTGTKDIQANLLLGSKGIDLPKIAQKLDIISSKRTFETVEPQEDVELVPYLESELRNCILSIIDQEQKKCFKQVRRNAWKHQLGEWKQEKRKILNAMTGHTGALIDTSKHNVMFLENTSVTSNLMGQEEAVYSIKVDQLIKLLNSGKAKPNLITYFANAAEDFKDKKVNEMWDILKYMTNLPTVPSTEDVIVNRNGKEVQLKLISQAKLYLQNRYKTYMSNMVDENRAVAERGGVPGTLPLVKSFVGLRFYGEYAGLEDGLIDGRPFWPVIYYCIRSGDLNAALHCLQNSNVSSPELIPLIQHKLHPSTSTATTSTTPTQQSQLGLLEQAARFQYRRHVRNSPDPFKRCVWAVLGCCDPTTDEHTEVVKSVDDYLWLKLSLVRVGGGSGGSGGGGGGGAVGGGGGAGVEKDEHGVEYGELQRVVLEECGEAYYEAGRVPWTYFQVLALTGQFEAAIEFLARIERYKVHAVHMAIALNELYLLAGPADYSSPLLFVDPADPKPARRLNIVRLILLYVRHFETVCIPEAVNYFYLLHNIHTSDGRNCYITCVSDLALETREFERLFGRMQRSGVRTKGVLDGFRHPVLTTHRVAKVVARLLEGKGLFEDAVRMYDIARKHEEVLTLLCALISQVVHLRKENGSLRDRMEVISEEIYTRYSTDGFRCSQSLVDSFKTLKQLLIFFNNYHTRQFTIALKVLTDLQIVAFQISDIEERVINFKRFRPEVCKVFPDVLLATMNMLYDQYQKLKGNELIPSRLDATVEKQLEDVRNKAKVLTNFTGMLPYRMPGDTNSRLVQMEILMH